jgi:hypothetical protein
VNVFIVPKADFFEIFIGIVVGINEISNIFVAVIVIF